MFQRNSYFQEQLPLSPIQPPMRQREAKLNEAKASTKQEVTNRQLEDWSHRLQSAAYEAGDEKLEVLESNLLDLRDEVLAILHSNC